MEALISSTADATVDAAVVISSEVSAMLRMFDESTLPEDETETAFSVVALALSLASVD